ncbi:PREDICTED: uncharacterized protein LOC104594111 [Nelumbo nucifera]|uniref:Uncharacterized protein LOC104594111 n=1 Tax=Nelumbo nucifera TaxID=4432 RepID=A0A1U7ZHR3_NELNU|nr:PREDICTED: uncharacterized protein LOC104594111 [Nelumbo nucifera]
MESVERGNRWKNLRERLGLKGIGCCGATWGFRPSNMSIREDDDDYVDYDYYYVDQPRHEQEEVTLGGDQMPAAENGLGYPSCAGQSQIPARSGMNLATALAAERHLRAGQDLELVVPSENSATGTTGTDGDGGGVAGTPLRVSLMRLLEEADGVDREREKGGRGGGGGSDGVCCVCMGRRKGAAFIPCGHTFCRVCSRELWLNRGSCPLCNRSILEILDIF